MSATFEDTRSIDVKTIKILILKSRFQKLLKGYPKVYPKLNMSDIKYHLTLPLLEDAYNSH